MRLARFKPWIADTRPSPAFTLVELLVVVSILVVLLALLTPAMDKAVYQAELATCGASVNGIGDAATAYATAQKRAYPHRPGSAYLVGEPTRLSRRHPDLDDRVALQPYLSFDQLLCPLNGRGKINLSYEASRPDTYVLGDYALWFQWPITASNGPGAKVLRRMGDRMEWGGGAYAVLASDILAEAGTSSNSSGTYWFSTHPDTAGRLIQRVAQNQFVPLNGNLPGIPPLGTGDTYITVAYWAGRSFGNFDLNFGYTDGSVLRFADTFLPDDDRFDKVPFSAANPTPTDQSRVPRK